MKSSIRTMGAVHIGCLYKSAAREKGIATSMDSRERALNNIFTEHFQLKLKHEWLYLYSLDSIKELRCSLDEYIVFYNFQRIHKAMAYATPNDVYIMVA